MGSDKPPSDQVADLARERAAFYDRRLRKYENAWRAGSLHAALDAVAFCHEKNIAPPAWVVIAVEALVARQLLVRSGRGRYNSRQAAFNENQKHYIRWDMVRELLDRGRELYDDFGDKRGLTLEKACAAVAEELEGTPAEGEDETVKKSYQLVEHWLAEGRVAEFYQPRFMPRVKPE